MMTTKYLITGSTFTIPIVRGFSRLCQVYMTLHKRSVSFEKPILDFYSPVNNAALSTTSDVTTFQLSIGSSRWPERPSDSVGEQWWRLREAAGVAYTDFCNRKSITAWDLEKVGHQGASHSGLSTKNHDIMTIYAKKLRLGASGDYALIYLVFENLFALGDGSVGVYD